MASFIKTTHLTIFTIALLFALEILYSLLFNSYNYIWYLLNLLICSTLLFINHREKNFFFWLWIIGVFQAGYVLEMFGVKTGKLFGEFIYGNNLGYKLNDVPLIIGLNWLILCYSAFHISNLIISKWRFSNIEIVNLGKVLLAAFLIVIIDILIEQVAPQLDFWYWKNQVPPIQNYTAWFLFSFCFVFFYQKLDLPCTNPIAHWVYIFQFLYFFGMNLMKNILL